MSYIPKRGDIVWVELNPQKGHEQAGHRPALILSPYEYNKKVGLCIASPITSKSKGYPFEVAIAGKIQGVVLSDQVRTLDYRARNIAFVENVDEEVLEKVLEKLKLLLFDMG
ncbi:mRNA interferase MazF [Nitratiruptor sp. YY08-26]|uniref:endoribonuclease MazF n=1 Tax=unclassified Nitratiruptor TaxID=2624044 RepID=UPI00191638BC|nr:MULTISPECIES: endoribonuclease MazF [unclassified Nitratiruptor]BCD62087.1 mRNA interferase MazF [Nitratiruptor sp. YY08-13]BCD66023.1 mRNA interferase MazF [Nitratiruptor sp. YY08-26]